MNDRRHELFKHLDILIEDVISLEQGNKLQSECLCFDLQDQNDCMNIFMVNFAFLVWKERNKRGWSQDQLSEKSGVDRTSIVKIEQLTRDPSLDAVIRLARVLELNVDVRQLSSALVVEDAEYSQKTLLRYLQRLKAKLSRKMER